MSEREQFLKMTHFERIKLFATLFLLVLFSLLFGYPAVSKLLDDETVFIEDKSEYSLIFTYSRTKLN